MERNWQITDIVEGRGESSDVDKQEIGSRFIIPSLIVAHFCSRKII